MTNGKDYGIIDVNILMKEIMELSSDDQMELASMWAGYKAAKANQERRLQC